MVGVRDNNIGRPILSSQPYIPLQNYNTDMISLEHPTFITYNTDMH